MRTNPKITAISRIGISLCIAIAIAATGCLTASAQEIVRDSVIVHFRLNKYNLDLGFRNNKARLDSLVSSMGDSTIRQVKRITVAGGASPEGSIALNDKLSRNRAKSFIDYLDDHVAIPDSIVHFSILGRDWLGLYNRWLLTPKCPIKTR